MNDIYLPTLKSINIKNFSLYPNGLDFTYNFIDGVNLIVGGNGIGKTTFINIIKYGLIGLYRKHKDSRRYKENKIIKRTQYSQDYFVNRMDKSYEKNFEAKVILTLAIKDTIFETTRSLYDIALEKVKVTEGSGKVYYLDGKVITQFKYEKLTNEEKKLYLQYKYEEKVAKLANLYDFDDFIFFVNEILLFGENRKTILWDIELQEVLSSKYFNDPEFDNKYAELKMDAKYNDSLSRHVSEDIRAIKGVMEKIQTNNSENEKSINIAHDINELKYKADKSQRQLESIQKERKLIESNRKIKYNDKQNLDKSIQELEHLIRNKENMLYKEIWEKLNPQYHTFLKYIKNSNCCPMCNKELDDGLAKLILHEEGKCILCHKEINSSKIESNEIIEYKDKLEQLLKIKQNIEIDIFNTDNNLKAQDNDFNKVAMNLADLQSKIRDLEYLLNSPKDNTNNDSITINKMMNEIYRLEIRKKELQDKSKACVEEAEKIASFMDQNRLKITRTLSSIFSEFAEKFLSVPCELTYDDIDGEGKRYIAKINGGLRIYPDELSESQCFFTDHSFRMGLLNYFYTTPSFFICETPESSLDISYEVNAANIFLKYLDKSNSLIITSNLNNSEFLDYIIENSPNISYINLLEIGKPSAIQSMSTSLIKVSKKIEVKINEKRINK